MDKDIFKLIMKQKNKLLLMGGEGGKARQKGSTTGVPTNVHVGMCLPQQVSNPGIFSWRKRKQEYARTPIPHGYVTLYTYALFSLTSVAFKVKITD